MTAAKNGYLESFKLLFDLGAHFYVTSAKLNNVLHNAIISENEELIKFVAWSDAENSSGYYLHN
jgi:hypothetical protein